ncbi:hypothetical protein BD560DRAFT_409386 [Blakeslea trispora]|nr:hypothetical protein BD560DRAFT_409386 [Blakeslea trispora]
MTLMTFKSNYETTIAASQSVSTDELEEAIKILEEETTRRIEDIQQQVEFMCESIRAQGDTYINSIIKPVRDLTVKEFCETFGASIQTFLDREKEQDQSSTPNQLKADTTEEDKIAFNSVEPFELHVSNDHMSELSLRLDPNWSTLDDSAPYTLTIPPNIQQQLNQPQKERIIRQIQALKDQLDLLQKSFLCSQSEVKID